MKSYYISQEINEDYDTYDSAVVAAPSVEAARTMAPDGDIASDECSDWAAPENVKVELIGAAVRGTKQGVICASYNAG